MDCHRYKLIRYKEFKTQLPGLFLSNLSLISVLSQLHCFPIKYRIEFKILLMTFKAIHGMAPDYICKLISQRKSTGYSLRSSKKVMLEVPSGKILPTLGSRAFCYAAPKLWNNLPSAVMPTLPLLAFLPRLPLFRFGT